MRQAEQARDERRQTMGFGITDKPDRMKADGRISDEESQRLRARIVS